MVRPLTGAPLPLPSPGRPGVGLALAPDVSWLAHLEPLLTGIDYASVTPETLWRGDAAGSPNGFHRAFADLHRAGLPFVAHSVGYSMGGRHRAPAEDARRARWRDRMRRDHDAFGFLWWTDHAGITTAAGENLALPLPVPLDDRSADRLRDRLAEMREIVPVVGVENTAHYFLPGAPLDEPSWLARVVHDDHLLLDLHNLYLMAENMGFAALDWLERAPLGRVVEVHIAGGAAAPEGWASRPLRLDSHDHAVPEAVWTLLEAVLPRCPALRGVTLERIEGSVTTRDAAVLGDELERLRATLAPHRACVTQEGAAHAAQPPASGTREAGTSEADAAAWESLLVQILRTDRPRAALAAARAEASPELLALLDACDPDGVAVAARLVLRLRFERLLHGDGEVDRWSAQDTAAFAAALQDYHASTPALAWLPAEEAALWRRWRG